MQTPEGGATMKELRRLHKLGQLPPAAERFMAESKPIEELYDLKADPYEVKNLVDDSKYQEVLKRVRTELKKWMFETK